MIELLGLRTVIYFAPDLVAATAWWAAFLAVEPYFNEPFYVGFNVAGYELGLLPDLEPTRGATTYWGVRDVAGAVSMALASGASVLDDVRDVGGGITTAAVTTPQGAVVGFIDNPHFQLP